MALMMMVFMAVMFYKVPSGLGIYFITSSLWSIGERLLLPKITHAAPSLAADGGAETGKDAGGRGKSGPGGKPGPEAPGDEPHRQHGQQTEPDGHPHYRRLNCQEQHHIGERGSEVIGG